MSKANRLYAIVMAGGNGKRLHPLTASRSKPALRFGTDHRVIDFVLANLRNSGVRHASLLVQHEAQGLVEHVTHHWPGAGDMAITAAASRPSSPYRGTADAVYQNLHLIEQQGADLVAVFGADHIYRMDVRQMVAFHLDNDADVSISALPVGLEQARDFGVLEVDRAGRISAFHEKPREPRPAPDRPGHALASMGNYIFKASVLRQALCEAHAAGETDFGHHVLPRLSQCGKVFAYDFATNVVPGIAAHEEAAYWRDVGTIDAYFEAHMDTLGSSPRFQPDNPAWPMGMGRPSPRPALVVGGQSRASRFGRGARIGNACLDHAVVGCHARVESDATLERCILFDGTSVGRAAKLRNVIVDEGNAVPAGEVIGYDPVQDRRRFPVSDAGVVVVPRDHYAAGRLLAAHG